MISPEQHIILFDGVCNLCNSVVQFVIRHDKKKRFHFTSLQSPAGQALLAQYQLPLEAFSSFVYIREGKAWLRSNAALFVCRDLGGFWTLLYALRIVPRVLRDAVYDFVARNRYRWFGKAESCMLPSPDLQQRFLN
jgi:predicted DCC family thiol-disulfide oxidoreductase YuxK